MLLAALHFNENSNKPQSTTQDGEARYQIAFPKYKKGGFIVRPLKEKRTFSKCKDANVCCSTLPRKTFLPRACL